MAAKNIGVLARQYLANRGGFRRYVHEQAFLALPPLLIRAAQELIPACKSLNILSSAIRSESDHNCLTEQTESTGRRLSMPARPRQYSCSQRDLTRLYCKLCIGRFDR